jgi:hypothetical protein
MSFDPCEDCGASLVPYLVFFWLAWGVPSTFVAIRRYLGPADPRVFALARAQWVSAGIVGYLSFIWVTSPWL